MATQPLNSHAGAAARLERSTVREYMELGLYRCAADDDISTLAASMAEHGVHCVVITGIERRDRSGAPLAWGIVSARDLVCALRMGLPDATAGQLAATAVLTVSPQQTLDEAVRLMAEHDTAHLVVVSPETGRAVGMLSNLDIARAVAGS